jgi:hypothetical protein
MQFSDRYQMNQPAFTWWVPHVLKKKECIIAKVKSKYWPRTHKFGIHIPKVRSEEWKHSLVVCNMSGDEECSSGI